MDPEIKDDSAPGGDSNPAGTGEGQQPAAPAAGPTEFDIDGQKYTPDQIKEALKAKGDYAQLVPEFTKKSQLVSKLMKDGVIDEQGNLKQTAANSLKDNPQAAEATRILKELGFITKDEAEELKKQVGELQSGFQNQSAEAQLSSATETLSKKFDGSKGEPKFDINAIRTAAQQNPNSIAYVQGPNGEFLVDLEQTYFKLNAEFYSKIPDMARKAVKTERGVQVQTTHNPNKKEPKTAEERTADAAEFFRSQQVDE